MSDNPNPGQGQPPVPPPAQPPTPPPPPPAEPTTQPQNTLEYWRSAYNGLQGHVAQVKTERDQLATKVTELDTLLKSEKAALVQTYEGQLVEAKTAKTQVETQLNVLTSGAQEKDTQLAQLGHKAEVQDLILTKHPGLINAYSKGILRTDGLTGETLDQYLGNFATEILAVQDSTRRQTLHGAPPPAPTPGDPNAGLKNVDQLNQAIIQARRAGDNAKADQLYQQYLQAISQP